jgi:hypothetical protein
VKTHKGEIRAFALCEPRVCNEVSDSIKVDDEVDSSIQCLDGVFWSWRWQSRVAHVFVVAVRKLACAFG